MTVACPGRQHRRWMLAAGVAFLLYVALVAVAGAQAGDNSTCLGCHTTPGLSVELASGETLPLTVDPHVYEASVHANQTCTSCHANIDGYPHPKVTAGDRRSFQMERYQQCRTCHPDQYRAALDSNHGRELGAGNRAAAICTDCHGSHGVSKAGVPRQKISETCSKCHSAIYGQYAESVHGAALLEQSNPDTPTCTDCHGVHSQEDPRTVAFRLKSPNICGDCHANAALMQKYGLSTQVFNTYVADFHGTTVTLFERQHPDQPTNKAVCTDCHGIHDIAAVSGEKTEIVKEKLLVTCQRCHPDATPNFPDSWVGHFVPSSTNQPLVYYVNLFYKILVPGVIGGMLLFVGLDMVSRIVRRVRRKGA